MCGRKNMPLLTVAKAMQLEVLTDLHRAVIAAMEQGQSFESFKKHIKPILQEKGWWGRKDLIDPLTGETVHAQLGSDRRLQTIYRVNMRSAYQKGQYERTMESDLHPYLLYRIGSSVKHRVEHLGWDGLILPKDDPWWDSHFPSNGWNCRCHTRAVS
jgi:SPP1 gp7 family putative phage head morphogenesis protein